MVHIDRITEKKEYTSSLKYRLKEYAAFPLFIIFMFVTLSGTLLFASFYAVDYSFFIIIAPLFLFLIAPLLLKASFYFTLFHPKIIIDHDHLTLPKKMVYSKP